MESVIRHEKLISEPLEREHRDIDSVLMGVIDGTRDASCVPDAMLLLRRHIYMEEAILFPRLSDFNLALTMHVSMMEIEHGYMWPMIEKLESGVVSGAPIDDIRKTCIALLELLQLHNTREEQILYAAADRMSAKGDKEPSLSRQISEAQLPSGWICDQAPGRRG